MNIGNNILEIAFISMDDQPSPELPKIDSLCHKTRGYEVLTLAGSREGQIQTIVDIL